MSAEQIVILGPTASGKTAMALQIAQSLDGEILSADSRQVFRGMNIGTGKDLEDYKRAGIRHHLIDITDAGELFDINQYFKAYKKAVEDVLSRKKVPILCGGSGLYIQTALGGNELAQVPDDPKLRGELKLLSKTELRKRFDEIDLRLQKKLDPSTSKRMIRAIEINEYLKDHPWPTRDLPDLKHRIYGINLSGEERRKRITKRLHTRLDQGMVEEVEGLLNKGISPDRLIFYGLEYKYITLYLTGQLSYEEMVTKLETEIHRFAKRQMTFFRSLEKKGMEIEWVSFPKV